MSGVRFDHCGWCLARERRLASVIRRVIGPWGIRPGVSVAGYPSRVIRSGVSVPRYPSRGIRHVITYDRCVRRARYASCAPRSICLVCRARYASCVPRSICLARRARCASCAALDMPGVRVLSRVSCRHMSPEVYSLHVDCGQLLASSVVPTPGIGCLLFIVYYQQSPTDKLAALTGEVE